MPIFGPGYTGPKEVKYLFVDGGCLRACLSRISTTYAGGLPVVPDYGKLAPGYSKVFYYDALPERRSDETEADYRARTAQQRQIFDQLSSLDRFHVYEGDVRRSTTRKGPKQKKIDVMIAVDMLTHSFRRNMHEATLLSGDLDFKPLLDALVHEGMFVTLWYPPNETSKELIAAADRSQPFNVASVHGALPEPKPFSVPAGNTEIGLGDYAPILLSWSVERGEAKLFQEPSGMFALAMPSLPNQGMTTYFKHPDLAILRAYVAEVHGWHIPSQSDP